MSYTLILHKPSTSAPCEFPAAQLQLIYLSGRTITLFQNNSERPTFLSYSPEEWLKQMSFLGEWKKIEREWCILNGNAEDAIYVHVSHLDSIDLTVDRFAKKEIVLNFRHRRLTIGAEKVSNLQCAFELLQEAHRPPQKSNPLPLPLAKSALTISSARVHTTRSVTFAPDPLPKRAKKPPEPTSETTRMPPVSENNSFKT